MLQKMLMRRVVKDLSVSQQFILKPYSQCFSTSLSYLLLYGFHYFYCAKNNASEFLTEDFLIINS